MGGARVAVSVDPLQSGGVEVEGARLSATGRDRVEFLIAPNPGEDPRPLARVASGGELSRALLALKRVLAEGGPVGLYVFDEVDTGVGGAVAEVIGQKLSDVAAHHQVLCITHAPQVAAYGDQHLHVHKAVAGGRTFSRVRVLEPEQRVQELGRMLGGIDVSAATQQAARDLLGSARRRAGAALAAK
jgi:DNA repair protein RecN (Recombination protein N)